MASSPDNRRVVGTFASEHQADLAADAGRKAGFKIERPEGNRVVLDASAHDKPTGEAEGILRAYGALEFGDEAVTNPPKRDQEAEPDWEASGAQAKSGRGGARRIRAAAGAKVELVEEELRARTRPVQTGQVTIRREVVTETRTIEVPIAREEIVIERYPVERQPLDRAELQPSDPLVGQLLDRLRHMRPGETLRIPIVEEEVVVQKRPVVIEEISVGKRRTQRTQKVSGRVRREEVHIEPHGDVHINEDS